MTLRTHAENELRAIGMLDSTDEMNKLTSTQILELIDLFASHGHSGFSAPYAVGLFEKLARFKPLAPLAGDDSEWHEVGEGHWQNKRFSSVFKDADGRAYDIDAVYYTEPNGCSFTRGGNRQYIEFPYTPTQRQVKVNFAGDEISDEEFTRLAAEYDLNRDKD